MSLQSLPPEMLQLIGSYKTFPKIYYCLENDRICAVVISNSAKEALNKVMFHKRCSRLIRINEETLDYISCIVSFDDIDHVYTLKIRPSGWKITDCDSDALVISTEYGIH